LRSYDRDAQIVLREGPLESLLSDLREFRMEVLLTDIGLRGTEREDFEDHLVAKVPIVLAAAPKMARNFTSLPKDFDGAPFLIPSAPSQVYGQILDLLSEWRVKPRIVAEIQDVELVRRMALAGEGIAPLNAFTVSMSLPKGGLVVIGARQDWGLRESVYLVTRRGGSSKAMVEHMRREMNPHKMDGSSIK
jgi:LysR family transcriptional activator of nhaA